MDYNSFNEFQLSLRIICNVISEDIVLQNAVRLKHPQLHEAGNTEDDRSLQLSKERHIK